MCTTLSSLPLVTLLLSPCYSEEAGLREVAQLVQGCCDNSQLVWPWSTCTCTVLLPEPVLSLLFFPQFSCLVSYFFPNRTLLLASWLTLEDKIADEARKFLWLITISSRIILLKVNSPSGFLFSQSRTPECDWCWLHSMQCACGPKQDEHNLFLLFLIKEESAFICLFNSWLGFYVLLSHNGRFRVVAFPQHSGEFETP